MACRLFGHYLNQCWFISNWIIRNKLQWNFCQKSNFFIQENAFENAVCGMAAILPSGRWVKLTAGFIPGTSRFIQHLVHSSGWKQLDFMIFMQTLLKLFTLKQTEKAVLTTFLNFKHDYIIFFHHAIFFIGHQTFSKVVDRSFKFHSLFVYLC